MTESPLVDEFSARWTSLTGTVRDGRGTDIRTALREVLSNLCPDAGPVLIFEEPGFPIPEMPEWFRGFGYEPILVRASTEGPVDADGHRWERTALKEAAARAALGVSTGAWAVAHTGSVAVYGDRDHGTWPSLLPPAHLILLHTDDIFATLGEGLGRLQNEPGGIPPEVKLITGPSSTGDIEGQPVIGVHGPARVGVLLLQRT